MNELLIKLKTVKIFERQPNFTKKDFLRLVELKLIITETFQDGGERRDCEVANRYPHDVVSYMLLSKAISTGKVSQEDARRLIALETIRANGRPRQSHFSRLLPIAFTADKQKVYQNIEAICQVKVQ